jgi:hypothetical protein
MAKFSITLFPEGDHVSITGGGYVGQTGVVAAWLKIAADHPDPIHVVKLDKAIQVEQRVYKRADGALVEEPAHSVETIEVPASQMANA